MTIEETIKRYTSNAFYEKSDGNLQGYLEFNQLAEWLKDYKRLLEQEHILDKISAEIESKIIKKPNLDFKIREREHNDTIFEVLDIIDKYRGET